MNACQTCKSGYAWGYDNQKSLIKFDQCISVPDLSCMIYDFAEKTCRMCHQNFSLDGNLKCQAVLKSFECLEFGAPVFSLDGTEPMSFYRDGSFVKFFLKQSQSLFGCAKCKSGFNLFTGSGKICVKDTIIRGEMLPNCELHGITETDETECFSCKETFILLNDKSGCILRIEVDSNCKKAIKLSANTYGCFECNKGYLPNSKFSCDQEGNLCQEIVVDDPNKGTYCKFCKVN